MLRIKSKIKKIGNGYFLYVPLAYIKDGNLNVEKEYEFLVHNNELEFKNIENGFIWNRTPEISY